MKNRLHIKYEKWPEVTETPHYIVEIKYEGLSYVHSDIYFDDVNEIISKLKSLEKDRKGKVELDGGFRFKLIIEARTSGGCIVKFRYTSDGAFPGKLMLEGYFTIEGEYTAPMVDMLIKLFTDGKEFVI
jgi:hypothetical protein